MHEVFAIYKKMLLNFLFCFSVVANVCITFRNGGFEEDFRICIQEKVANGEFRSEMISFSYLPPPMSCNVHSGETPSFYFFPDILFWDPLSRTSSLGKFLQCPKQGCCGKISFLRAVGWKDGKTKRDNPRF